MSSLVAIFGIGQMEILIIAGIVLLLFGHRLPSVMRSLGKGITEFKRGVNSTDDEDVADHEGDAVKEKKDQVVSEKKVKK